MKIVAIEAFDLVIPHKVECRPPWAPGRVETSRDFTLVIVRTDEGISGYGGGNGHHSARIRKAVTPFLVGENPFFIEKHARHLENAGNLWFVELALWDIVGKAANMPLYQLWGAARDRVPAYASTAELGTPAERAEQALRYVEEGFRAMKLRFHSETLQEDLKYIDAVLDAVGDRLQVMVDANQATLSLPSPHPGPRWDYRRALQTARELEDRGAVWLEEPLGRWDYEGLARLTASTDIYIAGGEANRALHEFRHMIEAGAYDILQPDVTMTASVSQVLKVKALCEAFNRHFMPHHGVSALGMAATVHIACTYPGWILIEYMYDPPYRDVETYQCLGGIVTTPMRIDRDGFIAPPDGPGLGVEIDEGAIGRYAVQ